MPISTFHDLIIRRITEPFILMLWNLSSHHWTFLVKYKQPLERSDQKLNIVPQKTTNTICGSLPCGGHSVWGWKVTANGLAELATAPASNSTHSSRDAVWDFRDAHYCSYCLNKLYKQYHKYQIIDENISQNTHIIPSLHHGISWNYFRYLAILAGLPSRKLIK